MLREAIDALGQECDLHLRRARVPFIGCVLPDHLLLAFGAERHREPFQLLGRLKAAAAGMSSSRGRATVAPSVCRTGEMARLIHQFSAIARGEIRKAIEATILAYVDEEKLNTRSGCNSPFSIRPTAISCPLQVA